jgi:hypothetical protein
MVSLKQFPILVAFSTVCYRHPFAAMIVLIRRYLSDIDRNSTTLRAVRWDLGHVKRAYYSSCKYNTKMLAYLSIVVTLIQINRVMRICGTTVIISYEDNHPEYETDHSLVGTRAN